MTRGRAAGHATAGERWLLIIVAALVALVSVLPLARLLIASLADGSLPSLAPIRRVLADPIVWTATRNSLETSLAAATLALIAGTVLALVITLTDIRGRSQLVFCLVVPLMIAPQVTALAWLQVAGPASPLLKLLGLAPPIGTPNPFYSRGGIIALLTVQYTPLVFLAVRAGLRNLPRELIEAARASGARPLTVMTTIVLPLMTPSLVAGAALAFVSSIGNFGIPAFLGIPGKYVVLPTLIYQRLAGLGPSVLGEVAVLSILIAVIAVGGIVVQELVLARRDFRMTGTIASRPIPLARARRPIEIALWLVVGATLALPFAGLLLSSIVPAFGVPLNMKTATTANYAYVLLEHEATRRALFNSLMLSFAAAGLVTVLAVFACYLIVWRRSTATRAMSIAIELPYAVPGVVLAIAMILLFLRPVPLLGIAIYNTVWIILFAYIARFLVLSVKPVASAFQQLERSLEEAAQVAGAGLLRRIRDIIAPLVAPAAAAGALLVFLTAFNELTVSALLWSSGAETLGVVVFSFEQGGESSYAAAVAMLTVALTLALMLITLVLGRQLPEGVIPWRA